MVRQCLLATLTAFVIGLVNPSSAPAQWRQDGIPAARGSGNEDILTACPDGAGGIYLAWRDGRNSPSSGSDIYVQRVTASGLIASGWPQDGIAACSIVGSQDAPAVVSDGAGGVFVAWQDARSLTNFDIYAQHIMADGTRASDWPENGIGVCAVSGDQRRPQVISDGVGGAFVSWDDQRAGFQADSKLYMAHILGDAMLDPAWPIDALALASAPGGQGDASIVADGTGGALVAWTDGRSRATTGFDVYAQRVTSAGATAPGWPESGLPVCTAPRDQGPGAGHMIVDAIGGAYITWIELASAPGAFPDFDIYAQHITGGGTVVHGWPINGVPVVVAPGPQGDFGVDGDGQGGLLIAWGDQGNGHIDALRLQPDGTRAPGWAVGGMHAGYGLFPRAVRDGSGGLFIAWLDLRYGSYDLFAQHLTATGVPAPGWDPEGLPLCTAVGVQQDLVMVGDGAQGAIAAWSDSRNNSTTYYDIYAERLVLDGPVPTLLSLVDTQVEPGLARLTWFAAGGTDLGAIVERRSEADESWQVLGSPNEGGRPGLLIYEDRIPAGGRYAYRMRYGAARAATDVVWVTIPSGIALSLAGFRPNPAVGSLVIALSLPSNAPATVELVDVAGRRVLAREVGDLGPGSHLVHLGSSTALRPGVYWLRLTQSGRAVVVRGVVAG